MPVQKWTIFTRFFLGRIAESSGLWMGRKIRERKAGEKGGTGEEGVNLSSESSSSFSCSEDGGRKRKEKRKKKRKRDWTISRADKSNGRAEGYTNGPRPKAKISS